MATVLLSVGTALTGEYLLTCSGKPKSKQKKKRSKKKNGVLQPADCEDAQEAEARPSSDPLPAASSTHDLEDGGQSSNSCWSPQTQFMFAPDQASNAAVAAEPLLSTPASLAGNQKPTSKRSCSALQDGTAQQDKDDAYEVSQSAHAKDMPSQQLQVAHLDQMSGGNTSEGGSEGWRQANGHSPQHSSPDRSASMDKDDAALLADMQGFACALGCDWQVCVQTALALLTKRRV